MDTIDNQWLLDELNDRIQTHYYNNGLLVHMTKWACAYISDFVVVEDGELVGVKRIEYIDFYPVGEFRCGRCRNIHKLSYNHHAFFNYNNECMICYHCNNETRAYADPPYPRVSCRIIDNQDISSMEDVIIVNPMPPKEHIIRRRFNRACKQAQTRAKIMDKQFLDGMCTEDVWHVLLAKRVIRAFRANVVRRTSRKVAYVLSHCTTLGKDTAFDIAKNSLSSF